jgi:hypothetical protein
MKGMEPKGEPEQLSGGERPLFDFTSEGWL